MSLNSFNQVQKELDDLKKRGLTRSHRALLSPMASASGAISPSSNLYGSTMTAEQNGFENGGSEDDDLDSIGESETAASNNNNKSTNSRNPKGGSAATTTTAMESFYLNQRKHSRQERQLRKEAEQHLHSNKSLGKEQAFQMDFSKKVKVEDKKQRIQAEEMLHQWKGNQDDIVGGTETVIPSNEAAREDLKEKAWLAPSSVEQEIKFGGSSATSLAFDESTSQLSINVTTDQKDEGQEPSTSGESSQPTDVLMLQLRVKDMKKVNGVLWFGKTDPFFVIRNKDGQIVAQSDIIDNNLNPEFPTVSIPMTPLLSKESSITVRFYDFDESDKTGDTFMGEFETTVQDLLDQDAKNKSQPVKKFGFIQLPPENKPNYELKMDGKGFFGYVFIVDARLDRGIPTKSNRRALYLPNEETPKDEEKAKIAPAAGATKERQIETNKQGEHKTTTPEAEAWAKQTVEKVVEDAKRREETAKLGPSERAKRQVEDEAARLAAIEAEKKAREEEIAKQKAQEEAAKKKLEAERAGIAAKEAKKNTEAKAEAQEWAKREVQGTLTATMTTTTTIIAETNKEQNAPAKNEKEEIAAVKKTKEIVTADVSDKQTSPLAPYEVNPHYVDSANAVAVHFYISQIENPREESQVLSIPDSKVAPAAPTATYSTTARFEDNQHIVDAVNPVSLTLYHWALAAEFPVKEKPAQPKAIDVAPIPAIPAKNATKNMTPAEPELTEDQVTAERLSVEAENLISVRVFVRDAGLQPKKVAPAAGSEVGGGPSHTTESKVNGDRSIVTNGYREKEPAETSTESEFSDDHCVEAENLVSVQTFMRFASSDAYKSVNPAAHVHEAAKPTPPVNGHAKTAVPDVLHQNKEEVPPQIASTSPHFVEGVNEVAIQMYLGDLDVSVPDVPTQVEPTEQLAKRPMGTTVPRQIKSRNQLFNSDSQLGEAHAVGAMNPVAMHIYHPALVVETRAEAQDAKSSSFSKEVVKEQGAFQVNVPKKVTVDQTPAATQNKSRSITVPHKTKERSIDLSAAAAAAAAPIATRPVEAPAAVGKVVKSRALSSFAETAPIETGDVLVLQLKAKGMKNIDGVLGRTNKSSGYVQKVEGWFGKLDPYFEVSNVKGEVVGISEVVTDNLNPEFKPVRVPMGPLCSGDYEAPIVVAFYDFDESGGDKKTFMGRIETSVKGLQEAKDKSANKGGFWSRKAPEPSYELMVHGVSYGQVFVVDASVSTGGTAKPDSVPRELPLPERVKTSESSATNSKSRGLPFEVVGNGQEESRSKPKDDDEAIRDAAEEEAKCKADEKAAAEAKPRSLGQEEAAPVATEKEAEMKRLREEEAARIAAEEGKRKVEREAAAEAAAEAEERRLAAEKEAKEKLLAEEAALRATAEEEAEAKRKADEEEEEEAACVAAEAAEKLVTKEEEANKLAEEEKAVRIATKEEEEKQKLLEQEVEKLAADEETQRKVEEEKAARLEAEEKEKQKAEKEEEERLVAEEKEENKLVEAAAAAAATAREALAEVVPSDNISEGAAPANDAQGTEGKTQDKTTNDNESPNARKRDPIEDMFDLMKPIPRVERPNKADHEKALEEINGEIENLITGKRKLQTQIDEVITGGHIAELKQHRDAMAKLRGAKGALIGQKKEIRSSLDVLRSRGDKLLSEKQKVDVRFRTHEEIDTEIARLRRMQETTSMALSAEKKLIKEIEVLQTSKKAVSNLREMESNLKDIQGQRGDVYEKLNGKDKEIDELQRQIEAKAEVVQDLSKKQDAHRDEIKKLFSKRDGTNKEIGTLIKKRDAVRTAFREKNREWQLYQRAIRAQKKMAYEEEKRKHEEEVAAWRRRKEAEEMRKTPYEEEMILCDYLTDYLIRTFVEPDASTRTQQKQQETAIATSTDNPFAGVKPYAKGESVFTNNTRGKNKKRRKRRDPSKPKPNTPFVLNIDTYEQFGLLNLDPPTTLEQVEGSVAELKAKRAWYAKQPRGSVPTAAEIRKNREKARRAKELSQQQKQNTLISQNDFVPLNAASAATSKRPRGIPSRSWGQVVTSGADETPPGAPPPADDSATQQQPYQEGGKEVSPQQLQTGGDEDEVDLLLAQLRNSGV